MSTDPTKKKPPRTPSPAQFLEAARSLSDQASSSTSPLIKEALHTTSVWCEHQAELRSRS